MSGTEVYRKYLVAPTRKRGLRNTWTLFTGPNFPRYSCAVSSLSKGESGRRPSSHPIPGEVMGEEVTASTRPGAGPPTRRWPPPPRTRPPPATRTGPAPTWPATRLLGTDPWRTFARPGRSLRRPQRLRERRARYRHLRTDLRAHPTPTAPSPRRAKNSGTWRIRGRCDGWCRRSPRRRSAAGPGAPRSPSPAGGAPSLRRLHPDPAAEGRPRREDRPRRPADPGPGAWAESSGPNGRPGLFAKRGMSESSVGNRALTSYQE